MKLTNKIFLIATCLLTSCGFLDSKISTVTFQESNLFEWKRESSNPILTTDNLFELVSNFDNANLPSPTLTPEPSITPTPSQESSPSPSNSPSPTVSPIPIKKGILSIENNFVLKENNKYKMWFDFRYLEDSTKTNTLKNRIGYLESEDGLKWSSFSEALSEKKDTWFSKSVFSPTVIFDEKQSDPYLMYFTAIDSSTSDDQIKRGYGYSIGLATSKDGLKFTPITQEQSPYSTEGLVLKVDADNQREPFTDTSIDKKEYLHISDPTIIKKDDTYYLWYTNITHKAFSSRFSSTIALATSKDGIKWDKKGTVLVSEQSWEKEYLDPSIGRPHILYNNANKEFEMFYDALSYSEKFKLKVISGVGYATSKDGLNWLKNTNNLIFKGNKLKGEEFGILPGISVLKEDKNYIIFYSGLNESGSFININKSLGIKK